MIAPQKPDDELVGSCKVQFGLSPEQRKFYEWWIDRVMDLLDDCASTTDAGALDFEQATLAISALTRAAALIAVRAHFGETTDSEMADKIQTAIGIAFSATVAMLHAQRGNTPTKEGN